LKMEDRKNGAELTMNQDNISALVMAMTVVVSVIIGFTIYFNNPGLNQACQYNNKKTKAWS
jgi:hypothetical protein